eukprot:m.30160 g.30160  ORF g.30160 m.30160 type:complete len:136 (+) comp13832_c0_seq3:493-900(+)
MSYCILILNENACPSLVDCVHTSPVGFPVGEYIAAGFIGLFALTHIEDIRLDNWAAIPMHKYQPQQHIARRSTAGIDGASPGHAPSTGRSSSTHEPRPLSTHSSQPQAQTCVSTPDYVSTFKPPGTAEPMFESAL